MRNCDCGIDPGEQHESCCMSRYDEALDPGAQAAAEDGLSSHQRRISAYPRLAAAITHPSHAQTRQHFAASPLPVQQDRRAS